GPYCVVEHEGWCRHGVVLSSSPYETAQSRTPSMAPSGSDASTWNVTGSPAWMSSDVGLIDTLMAGWSPGSGSQRKSPHRGSVLFRHGASVVVVVVGWVADGDGLDVVGVVDRGATGAGTGAVVVSEGAVVGGAENPDDAPRLASGTSATTVVDGEEVVVEGSAWVRTTSLDPPPLITCGNTIRAPTATATPSVTS